MKEMTNYKFDHTQAIRNLLFWFVVSFVCSLDFSSLPSAQSETLQGQVEQEDDILRVKRADQSTQGQTDTDNGLPRIPSAAPSRFDGKLVDLSAFSAPLRSGVQQNNFDGKAQLARPEQFSNIPDDKFDLGSERGSRELVLAWTKWHHQLSQAIYSRWAKLADASGQATVKMTVNRDRTIQLVMVKTSGNQEFDRTLLEAIFSLNGNPGLTFPTGSQRQQVTMESDYVAGRNIDPGFNWVTDDYEKVKESY